MDSKPKPEYDKFKDAMKRLMKVPLADVKELEKKKRRPKRPSASRVAAAKS